MLSLSFSFGNFALLDYSHLAVSIQTLVHDLLCDNISYKVLSACLRFLIKLLACFQSAYFSRYSLSYVIHNLFLCRICRRNCEQHIASSNSHLV